MERKRYGVEPHTKHLQIIHSSTRDDMSYPSTLEGALLPILNCLCITVLLLRQCSLVELFDCLLTQFTFRCVLRFLDRIRYLNRFCFLLFHLLSFSS
jgi:hypothetical protein